jgi:hypothetical protein
MRSKDLKRDVTTMYYSGKPLSEISSKLRVSTWNLHQIINSIISSHPGETKSERIERARVMEANIFDLIKKGKKVDHLVQPFSSYCP